jgi:molybdenum cofactor cytidylyltransferase
LVLGFGILNFDLSLCSQMSFQSKSQKPKTKDQRPNHNIAAIVLAAGQSKRMGAFKPLLPFGNHTVIESCINYLINGGVQTIVVVLGHRAEEIKARLTNLPILFAFNPNPDSEMSESIACGVRVLPLDNAATFIAPADYPAIPPTVVVDLIKQYQAGPAKLLLPEYQGRGGHPVLVDLCLRAQLLRLDSRRGLRALFESHRDQVRRIPINSPFVARDIDTWDDYRALYREVTGGEPPDLLTT